MTWNREGRELNNKKEFMGEYKTILRWFIWINFSIKGTNLTYILLESPQLEVHTHIHFYLLQMHTCSCSSCWFCSWVEHLELSQHVLFCWNLLLFLVLPSLFHFLKLKLVIIVRIHLVLMCLAWFRLSHSLWIGH